MPYAQSNLKDEELKKQQAGSAPNISGTSTTFATGVPGQESSKKSSGQYANIQSYLDTNKEQAGEMGQKVASSVEQKGNEAKSGVDKLASSVSKIEAYDPNAVIGKITNFNTNPWDPNSGAQAPEITQQEKDQYKSMKTTGGYTGPKDLGGIEGYQDIETKARQATQAAKGAATEQGQQALLKETYARPTYTAGQNKLDQVLLGGSQVGKQAIESASSKYAGLEDLFKDTSTKVGNTINDNINTAYYNQQAFSPAEQAAKNDLISQIEKQAQIQTAANKNTIDKALSELSNNNLTLSSQLLSQLGLNTGTNIYDLNLNNYLNTNANPVSLNAAADSNQRNKYLQLSELFGDSSMNQITDKGENVVPISFDRNKLASDIDAARQRFNETVYNAPGGVLDEADYQGANRPFYDFYNNKSANEIENVYLPEKRRELEWYQNSGSSSGQASAQQAIDWMTNALNKWHAKNDRIIKSTSGVSNNIPITGGIKGNRGSI